MEKGKILLLTEHLANCFNLTATERQICVFLAHGNYREDIMRLMNLKPEAIKFHLKNIYAKILPESRASRNKLHRLTVLLWQIREKYYKEWEKEITNAEIFP